MNERMKVLVAVVVAFIAVTQCTAEKDDGAISPKGIRFTHFTISSGAVSFTASLPASRDSSERKFDLFATRDMGANDWKLIGSYDIASSQTELVGKLQLEALPFPASDRLFLALKPHVSDVEEKSGKAKRVLLRGTTVVLVDTDGDGLADSFEVEQNLNPQNPDCDNDGYVDGEEILAGTSPLSSNGGAGSTIRYYYDMDDRLLGAYSGSDQASSASVLSSAGNPTRQTSR